MRAVNTEADRRYQRAHTVTRQVVERLFGMWNEWRDLCARTIWHSCALRPFIRVAPVPCRFQSSPAFFHSLKIPEDEMTCCFRQGLYLSRMTCCVHANLNHSECPFSPLFLKLFPPNAPLANSLRFNIPFAIRFHFIFLIKATIHSKLFLCITGFILYLNSRSNLNRGLLVRGGAAPLIRTICTMFS